MAGRFYSELEADRMFSEMHSGVIAAAKAGEVETALRELEAAKQFAELHGLRFSKDDENTIVWTAYSRRVKSMLEDAEALAASGDVTGVEAKLALAKTWAEKGGIKVNGQRLGNILKDACTAGINNERRSVEDIIRACRVERNIDSVMPRAESSLHRARQYAARIDFPAEDIERVERLFYALACGIKLGDAELHAKSGNGTLAKLRFEEAKSLAASLGSYAPKHRIEEVEKHTSHACISELIEFGRFSLAAEELSEGKRHIDYHVVQNIIDDLVPNPENVEDITRFLNTAKDSFEDICFDDLVLKLADVPDTLDYACLLTDKFACHIDSDVHARVAAKRPAEYHISRGHFYLASRAIEEGVVDADALIVALDVCNFYELEPSTEDVEAFVEASAEIFDTQLHPFRRLRAYLVDKDEMGTVEWLDENYSSLV